MEKKNTNKKVSRARKVMRPPKQVKDFPEFIDYKDAAFLKNFLSDRGKMLPRRLTGTNAKQQRHLAVAIKRARFLGLLPSGSVKRK